MSPTCRFFRHSLTSLLLCFGLGASTLLAQSGATLEGRVSEPSGAAAPGTRLVLVSAEGSSTEVRTDKEGRYVFIGLDAGHYTLHVNDARSNLEQNVTLGADERRTVDVVLKAEIIDTITVREMADTYFRADPSLKTGVLTTLQETPSVISMIGEELIADQHAQGFDDLTRNIAGLTTRGTYYGGYTRINLRGFGLDEQESFYRNGVKTYRRGALMVDNVERIEVLKGPASVLANDIAPGGLVNIVTKKPLSRFLMGADLSLGSEGERKARVDYNQPDLGRASLRINASFENSESFVDEVELQRFFVAPVLRFQATNSTSIILDLEIEDSEGTVGTGLFVPPARLEEELIAVFGVDRLGFLDLQDESTFLGEPDADYSWDRQLFNFELAHVFDSGTLLQATGSFADHQRDIYGITLESFVDDDPSTGLVERGDGLPGDSGFFLSDQETLAVQVSLRGTASSGKVDHTWLAGADWEDRERDFPLQGGEASPIDIFDPVYTNDFVLTGDVSSVFTADSRVGLFAQDNLSFTNGLDLLLGLRYTDFNNDRVSRGGVDNPNATDHEDVTYRVGLSYTPPSRLGTTAFISYNTSFLPVNAAPQAGLPNPVPVEGEQFEIGVKQSFFEGRLFGQLSYYDISQENLVVGFGTQRQVGEVTTEGFELEILGRVTDRFDVSVSLATNDRENPENTPGFRSRLGSDTPDVTASVWLAYDLSERLTVGGGGEFVDERPIPTGGGQIFVPSYEKLDLFASYRFDSGVGLRLNLENVTDERYYVGQQVFNGTGVIVGAPRTATLTFSYRP